MGTVRLVDLEREVLNPTLLGWHREDDVSSKFIPQFYFDYLRGGPPEPLLGVARHNQMDLRGLAALLGKMNGILADGATTEDQIHGLDLFGLSKFLHRRGDKGRAQVACAQAVDAGLPLEFHARAQADLALMAKRRGDHQLAAELWHEIAENSPNCLEACEQLAMHYERRSKDYEKALEFARRVRLLLRARHSCTDIYSRSQFARNEELAVKRIRRLEARLSKRSGGGLLVLAAVAASGED